MEEHIQGYIDEYESIIKTERTNKPTREKYEFLIIFLKNLKSEIKQLKLK